MQSAIFEVYRGYKQQLLCHPLLSLFPAIPPFLCIHHLLFPLSLPLPHFYCLCFNNISLTVTKYILLHLTLSHLLLLHLHINDGKMTYQLVVTHRMMM